MSGRNRKKLIENAEPENRGNAKPVIPDPMEEGQGPIRGKARCADFLRVKFQLAAMVFALNGVTFQLAEFGRRISRSMLKRKRQRRKGQLAKRSSA